MSLSQVPHLICQLMYGCDWDNETGAVDGYAQLGYDGEDFITFDPKTPGWIAHRPEACIDWLKVLDYGKSTLLRTERPTVSLLQKSPSSPVSCHATGFYPDSVLLF
ncbi:class I histocompatibility antigen, F10 alpha chain-like [Diretmus argenteus]